MVDTNYYSNKKGIYKDLYIAINAENKKDETFQAFRQRKGIYRDIYRNIELNKTENKIKKRINIEECINSFGNGFVASLKAIFQAPKDIIAAIGLILCECIMSKKKQLHIISKLGKIACVLQLLILSNEMWLNKKSVQNSCYYVGSGFSSIAFGNKYTGLLNCFVLAKTLNNDKG